jgi:uncharacterized protein (TIGR03435 family)
MIKLVALCVLLSICTAGSASVQRTFNASSIRANQTKKDAQELKTSPVTLTIHNLPLNMIIGAAYGIADYQLSGPSWLKDERFDIIAKTDAPVADDDEMMVLLQRLLADRFRLTLHRETKQLPAYQLVVAKNGPKLEPTDNGSDLPFNKANKDKGSRIAAEHLTMPQFAEILSRRLRHPVQDATGLTGAYRVSLDWAGDDPKDKTGKPGKETPTGVLPSIFTALQEQMGLRLESRKAQVAALVIDHVAKTPTPN